MAGAVSLGLTVFEVSAQEIDWSPKHKDIDALFEDVATENTPGCAVGVIHEGEFLHQAGYGMANLEHGIPITPDSIFRTGSLSKQFTAMAVAILAQRGDLQLDADIHSYLPELIEYDQDVSVRDMVHHVSGMGDYEEEMNYFQNAIGSAFRWGNQDYLTTSEFYSVLTKVPLALPARSQYQYSNYAYFLLGQAVQRVSGKSLREFSEAEIFQPIGMTKSFFNDHANGIVPGRVDGYRKKDDGSYDIFMTNLEWVGDGGVYTSINEFIKWDQNFYNNRLGDHSDDLMHTVMTPHAIRPREDAGYGFGMFVRSYNGHREISHGGGWVGFRSYYARYPDLNFSVVTFCSSTDISARQRARRIIEIYLGSKIET